MVLLKTSTMKTLFTTVLLALVVAATTTIHAQDRPEEYLGLPGDNLNLYAVMKIFQESETLEGFERSINEQNTRVNNLDLNGDNLVDYIMVLDYVDGDDHNIVLRVALSRDEYQDVAVFTVQRLRDGSVHVQLIGDEALYGRNYIIEPYYAGKNGETPNPAYIGATNRNATIARTTTIHINAWPVVRYIYRPNYVVWRSSWYWGYQPYWWNPWQPYYWHYYYGYHYNWRPFYQRHFRVCNDFRYSRYNDYYFVSIRNYSPRVKYKINQGHYKTTYSRPEMRREGEALYARTYSERNAITQNNARVTNESRRSASTSARYQATENSRVGTERRANSSVTERPVQNSTAGQRIDARRNSSSTENERTPATKSASQRTEVTRREPVNSTIRSANSPAVAQRNNSSARESATINNRSTATPSVSQRTEVTRREPANTNIRSANTPAASQRNNSSVRESASSNNRSASTVSTKSASNSQASSGVQPANAPEERQSNQRVRSGSQESRSNSAPSRSSNSNESSSSRTSRR